MTGFKAGMVARFIASGFVVLSILVGIAGCGKGDTNISGTVTYKGKPISSGLLEFDSKIPFSAVVTDGKFQQKKVPGSGKLKVKLKVDKDCDPKEAFTDQKKIGNYATSGKEVDIEDFKDNVFTIDFN